MKKLPIVLTILAGCAMSASAATALRVVLTDGTEATYVLSRQPVVTYPGNDLAVTCEGASATYPRADVVRMDFTEVSETSVEDVLAQTANSMAYINGTVLAADTDITVYDLAGRIRATGHGSLSLADLPSGVYVATAAGKSLKIVK